MHFLTMNGPPHRPFVHLPERHSDARSHGKHSPFCMPLVLGTGLALAVAVEVVEASGLAEATGVVDGIDEAVAVAVEDEEAAGEAVAVAVDVEEAVGKAEVVAVVDGMVDGVAVGVVVVVGRTVVAVGVVDIAGEVD